MRTRWPSRRAGRAGVEGRRVVAAARSRRRAAPCRTGWSGRSCAPLPARTFPAYLSGRPAGLPIRPRCRCRRVQRPASSPAAHGPRPGRPPRRGRPRCRRRGAARAAVGRASSYGTGAGVPGGRAGTEHRPQVVGPTGPAAASSRCPAASRTKLRPWPRRRAQRRRELAGSQRGQVGGQRRRPSVPGCARAASAAPWASAGFSPASGASPVTSAPTAASAAAASGSSVTTWTAATSGQASAAAAVSSAKARASRAPVAGVRRAEPGLGDGEPLDRQHEAPASARVRPPAADPCRVAARHRSRGGREDVDPVGPADGRRARGARVEPERGTRRGSDTRSHRLLVPAGRRHPASRCSSVLTRRDWRGAEHLPADRRRRRGRPTTSRTSTR